MAESGVITTGFELPSSARPIGWSFRSTSWESRFFSLLNRLKHKSLKSDLLQWSDADFIVESNWDKTVEIIISQCGDLRAVTLKSKSQSKGLFITDLSAKHFSLARRSIPATDVSVVIGSNDSVARFMNCHAIDILSMTMDRFVSGIAKYQSFSHI